MKYSKHTLLVGDDGGPLHGATRGTAYVGCGGAVEERWLRCCVACEEVV